jgi:hypothetical protein
MQLNQEQNISYYIFDWDDNLLHMDTEIFVEYNDNGIWKPTTITSSHYRIARKSSLYRSVENGYRNCHGDGPEFLNDVKKAIKLKSFGPSFNSLIKSFISGNIISIVTARGHDSKTIRSGVEYIISHCLSKANIEDMLDNLKRIGINSIDQYLDACIYVGIYSEEFLKTVDISLEYNTNTENYKKIAIERIIKYYLEYSSKFNCKVSIGFSDDDKFNVLKITDYFKDLKRVYPDIHFSIFDTSEKKHDKLMID